MTQHSDALVVVVGDTPWHGHRLAAQHIAEGLSAYTRVLYVDPPMSPIGVRRLRGSYGGGRWRGLEELDSDRLYRLGVLVNPGKTRRGGRAVARALFRSGIVRATRQLGGHVHATIQIPVHFPVLGALGETHRVHLASDDFVAAAAQNSVDAEWVRGGELRIAASANEVVAVSDVLADRWRALGFEPTIIPNGCDVERYAETDDVDYADDVVLRPPIAGFVGTISDRTDVPLLEALADRGRSILLVGPRSFTAPNAALDALFARPNVQWVGARDHTDLPGYLRHMKVGLVPYRLTDFNNASFPLKTLDYLAAGRAVVSTDLAGVRAVGTDVVTIGTDPESFVAGVERHLDEVEEPSASDARRSRAEQHSWTRRVADFADLLELAPRPQE